MRDRALARACRGLLLVLASVVLAGSGRAGEAISCPDKAATPIAAATGAGVACQQAIAKAGASFLRTKTRLLAKCRTKDSPSACPRADDLAKIEKAAQKAQDAIAARCGDDAAQAALGSSYADLGDETLIGSCMLSQHNAIADLLLANATGIFTQDFPAPSADDASTAQAFTKARRRCIAEVARTGVGYGLGAFAAMSKCLDAQTKLGTPGDLAPVCVGSWSGNAFTPPTDPKTAAALAKLQQKATAKLASRCADPDGLGFLPSIFACGGPGTVPSLEQCVVCEGFGDAVDLVQNEYGERGSIVQPGPNAIEDAVNAAPAGAKLLIASGDYPEQVTLETDGLQLVGCGGATNHRPRIVRPDGVGPFSNGIFGSDLSDLLFQSLEVVNWDDNGIFVSGGMGVTFRDVVGDGGDDNSTYAIFPVNSDGVVVEGCTVRRIADAGIYVGQSSNILVRHNRVFESVAGIEIENSAFAIVQNNYATGDTGGILVFKLPNYPVQTSMGHLVSHNLSEANNRANIGMGEVGNVPAGTGMLIISTDDSLFEYNVVRGNTQLGLVLTDQSHAMIDPLSPDQATERNLVTRNWVTGNGLAPQSGLFPATDLIFAIVPATVHGNCIEDNVTDLPPVLLLPSQCTP